MEVGNMLNGVLNGMGKVIHGINAPLISRIVMLHMSHTVNNGSSHVDIGLKPCRSWHGAPFHRPCTFLLHLLKKAQVFFNGTVSVGAFLTGIVKVAAVLSDLLCGKIAYKGLSLLNQEDSAFIHLFKIIGCKKTDGSQNQHPATSHPP